MVEDDRVTRSLLRNSDPTERGQSMIIGDLEIRPSEGVVLKRGSAVHLTKTEFRLFCHLAAHVSQVLSREQLLDAVWDYSYTGDGRLVDTHVARLRAKVESHPNEPEFLVTVRGLGYKLMR